MFAVHALWHGPGGGRLALWAEDARALDAARGPVPYPGGGATARPHPFACPAALLADLLGGIGPGLGWLAGQAAERWTTLTLPSLSGVPAASPELLGGRAAPSGVSLHAWRVPALVFEPAEAAQLLGELFDPRWALTSAELDGPGRVDVAYGSSLRWLTAVHDLAWRLVGGGQVLPALVELDGAPYARWQPVLGTADRREATALAEGCPPVARAGRPGPVLLAEVLEALTDREVRATLADHPGVLRLPRGVGAAGEPDGQAAERWFAALGAGDGLLAVEPGEPRAALDRLADRLAAWHASGGPEQPAVRLCFRLVEPLGPDPADPEEAPPTTTGGWNSCCRPSTSPRCWSPPANCGPAVRRWPPSSARSRTRRAPVWPSWTGPCDAGPSCARRCARPGRAA